MKFAQSHLTGLPDTSAARHFGSTAEVSVRHIGSAAAASPMSSQ